MARVDDHRVDDHAIDSVAATVQQYGALLLATDHTARLALAKQIVEALETMTIAQQERYYTTIFEIRRDARGMRAANPRPPDDAEELIEWG